MELYRSDAYSIQVFNDDVMNLYDQWDSPMVIISDGPYGVKGFKGDLYTPDGLDEWYEPHIAKWTEKATPQTTLWFWGIERGWVKVHPILEKYGWEFRACNVWDKGMEHVAGNVNSKSLRQLPVVTEICVQYVKKPSFTVGEKQLSMKDWLRYEWKRTGMPFSKTNEAAGVANAATRKWFTDDYLWYMPPPDMFEKIVNYANINGNPQGKPYFSIDGVKSLTASDWEKQRAKFYCPFGVTNVWRQSPVNGVERIKNGSKAVHLNQKPLNLMKLCIETSSDIGDLIWEPFGGLCTGAIAAHELNRSYVSAEITKNVFDVATKRFKNHFTMNLEFPINHHLTKDVFSPNR